MTRTSRSTETTISIMPHHSKPGLLKHVTPIRDGKVEPLSCSSHGRAEGKKTLLNVNRPGQSEYLILLEPYRVGETKTGSPLLSPQTSGAPVGLGVKFIGAAG